MATLQGLFTLGRDIEIRSTNTGKVVGKLALAYNYGMKGEDGRKPSQWVNASIWGNQAEALAPYLLKGKQISATLRDVHIRSFESNGETKHSLDATVLDIELCRGGSEGQQQQRQAAPVQRQPQRPAQSSGFDDVDSDIPF